MILTANGSDALIKFTDETDAVIITRGLSQSAVRKLESMLKDWIASPTKAIRNRIIKMFASDLSEDKEL